MIVVYVTAKNLNEAKKIARGLINKRLAACVNIIKEVTSLFFWAGKIDNVRECLLIIKSRKSLFNALKKEVKKLHSYEVPEIIALPVLKSETQYKKWVYEVTK